MYPTIEKQYQYNTGTDLGDPFNHDRTVLRAIKQALIGFPVNPWRVVGSCDAVTYGMHDGLDRWDSDTDLVWEGSNPHSWIVFENAAGLQWLWECRGFTGDVTGRSAMRMYISANGFTGGTLTARPTATDEAPMTNTASAWTTGDSFSWHLDWSGSVNRLHILHSTDGRETRVFFSRSGSASVTAKQPLRYGGAWALGELAEHPSTITKPFFGFIDWVYPNAYTAMWWSAFEANSTLACFLPSGPARCQFVTEMSYALEGASNLESGNQGIGPTLGMANEISHEWPMQEIFAYHKASGAMVGRIKDLWLVSNNPGSGARYPSAAPRPFTQFANLAVPWGPSMAAPVIL